MEIKTSIESIRDFSIDAFNAGRLAVASIIARVDESLANACNGDQDD